ncbi:MAG: Methyltransferase domain protein [Gemmataceae bacterium]|nr:Methyltransferase domain protein [Gemmataceae bacterium]
MSTPDLDLSSVRQLVAGAVHSPDFRRATFGGAVRGAKECPWVRVVLRPVDLRGERHVQFSYFDRTKNVTKNCRETEADGPLTELLDFGFAGIHLSTGGEEIDIRTSKKGKVLLGRRTVEPLAADGPERHNRVKDVPLPEGRADRVLEVMGILTADGRVRPTMRAKYTQINEFLKHLTHVFADAGLGSLGRPVEILDCGCGSSYLTLAAHHYLNDTLGIPARVIGVDVNEEVIRKSTERAGQLGAPGLSFACGRIGTVAAKPDVVFALHACDTATDDAIAQAVTTGAKLLLSVPCCHHHLNKKIQPVGPAAVLGPVLRHGILRERTADLVTDTFRALALRIMGYRTDVVEFVSPEHTARNLMIRAVRGAPVGEPSFVGEYLSMRSFWGVVPYIEQALGESFRRLLPES